MKSRDMDLCTLCAIGERIKEERERLELTQKELGRKIGVCREIMSQIENGARDIKTERLVRLADALGVTADYLLGRTGNPDQQSCAEDELGLSHKAIQTILRLKTENDHLDGLKNLEKLLSATNPEIILYGIKIILSKEVV